MTADELAREFFEFRPRLLAIAYRMLGSAWDAEDVVADAMVKWMRVDRQQIEQPLAYLTTIVTRRAIDELRSARRARETYPGPWLPEPLLTDSHPGPLATLERREAVSLATLRMMESLTPPERAVLVLHEAFDVPHAEIASILDITVAAARQHLHRARTRISREPGDAVRAVHDTALERFLAALEKGDLAEVRDILAADVVAFSDGGGKATAARRPIVGVRAVIRFFAALRRHYPIRGVTIVEANGQTAATMWFGEQYLLLAIDLADGKIREIHSILNPDKLRYLDHQLAERWS